MFTLRARTMGYRVVVLDPDSLSPGAAVADQHIRTGYEDPKGLTELFAFMALLATVATLVLYLFATIAALRLMVRGQLSRGLLFVTLVGAVYSIWTFYGAGKEATLWGLLLLMTAIPVWFGMRLSSLWSSPAPAAAPAGPPESLS